jgi:hypothetical protein
MDIVGFSRQDKGKRRQRMKLPVDADDEFRREVCWQRQDVSNVDPIHAVTRL